MELEHQLKQYVLEDGSVIEAVELPVAQSLGLNDDDAHGDKSEIEGDDDGSAAAEA